MLDDDGVAELLDIFGEVFVDPGVSVLCEGKSRNSEP
jgi:hypothetical protein